VRSIATSESSSRYGPVAIFLHWTVAALILAAWLMPQVTDLVGRHEAAVIMGLHRSIGVTVFVLVLARVVWRLVTPPPALPAQTRRLVRLASHAGHAALYLLMLAVPAFGMLFTWAAGRDISVWGLVTLPAPFARDDNLRELFINLHALAANGIMMLAGLHVAAALFHHYVLKDGLLARMLPVLGRPGRLSRASR
jgi:cytochrome b561